MSDWGGRKAQRLSALVVAVYGARCYICLRPIDLRLPRRHPRGLWIDHVQPRHPRPGDGPPGGDELENLRPSHRDCNQTKSNKVGPGRRVVSDRGFLVGTP